MDDWIPIKEAATLLGVDEAVFLNEYTGRVNIQIIDGAKHARRSSLPVGRVDETPLSPSVGFSLPPMPTAEIDMAFRTVYNNARPYNRAQYDKWFPIVRDCAVLKRGAISEYVDVYNQEHPTARITLATLYKKLGVYRSGGKEALLGGYGKNRGASSVPDVAYEAFEAIYMKNVGTTLEKSRRAAVGLAINSGVSVEAANKSVGAFKRRLDNSVSKPAQCYAREGESAYGRKHAPYIKRDRSNMLAGRLWVSDHFQLDTFAMYNGKAVRVWGTSWIDDKSGKILASFLHPYASTADDIFTAFYDAVAAYGSPNHILIDNGKDYRCKDFAGGRGSEQKRNSLLDELMVTRHYALPYNAQAKSIERVQREINATFSPLCKGYCGNTVLTKPENLRQTIASGVLESFEELTELFNETVTRIVNTRIITSGPNKGKSPDQVFDEEYRIARTKGLIKQVPDDHLKLLCYRTSKEATVQRGYFKDKDTGLRYTSDMLVQYNGRRAYLMRSHKAMETADVYDAATNEFLCSVSLILHVPVIAETELEYNTLKKAYSQNKRINKFIKDVAASDMDIAAKDAIAGMKIFNEAVARGSVENAADVHNTVGVTMLTSKAGVISKKAALLKDGLMDTSVYTAANTARPQKPKCFDSEYDVEVAAAAGDPQALAILERKRIAG